MKLIKTYVKYIIIFLGVITLGGCKQNSIEEKYKENPLILLKALSVCKVEPLTLAEQSLSCGALLNIAQSVYAQSFARVHEQLISADKKHNRSLLKDKSQRRLQQQRCDELGKLAYTKNSMCLLLLEDYLKRFELVYRDNIDSFSHALEQCLRDKNFFTVKCMALSSLQKTRFYKPLQNFYVQNNQAFSQAQELCQQQSTQFSIVGSFCQLIEMTVVQAYITKYTNNPRNFVQQLAKCQQGRYRRHNSNLCSTLNKIKPLVNNSQTFIALKP